MRLLASGWRSICLLDKLSLKTPEMQSTGATMKKNNHIISVLNCLTLAIVAASVSVPVSAAPVPVPGAAPVAVDRVRPGNPAVLPMTGTWKFKLDHGISPAVRGELPADTPVPDFVNPDASDADWKTIPVPANWEIEGFSTLT